MERFSLDKTTRVLSLEFVSHVVPKESFDGGDPLHKTSSTLGESLVSGRIEEEECTVESGKHELVTNSKGLTTFLLINTMIGLSFLYLESLLDSILFFT